MALILTIGVAVALIPARDEAAAVSVLVVAVVVAAGLTDVPTGVIVGVAAAAAHHLWLQVPTRDVWPLVDGWDDGVTSAALLVIAVFCGAVAQHRRLLEDRAAIRWGEIVVLRQWVGRSTMSARAEIDAAGHDVARVLRADRWSWDLSEIDPVASWDVSTLYPDGTLVGRVDDVGPNRQLLPRQFVIPVRSDEELIGRFVICSGEHPVSVEERLIAGAIVERLELDLGRTPPTLPAA